jgi:hypothetical protein
MLSDFTERNPIRFGLINLQVLLYAIWHHAVAANVLASPYRPLCLESEFF